jgi:dolichol kinase
MCRIIYLLFSFCGPFIQAVRHKARDFIYIPILSETAQPILTRFQTDSEPSSPQFLYPYGFLRPPFLFYALLIILGREVRVRERRRGKHGWSIYVYSHIPLKHATWSWREKKQSSGMGYLATGDGAGSLMGPMGGKMEEGHWNWKKYLWTRFRSID